jgi:hypothetical protein
MSLQRNISLILDDYLNQIDEVYFQTKADKIVHDAWMHEGYNNDPIAKNLAKALRQEVQLLVDAINKEID